MYREMLEKLPKNTHHITRDSYKLTKQDRQILLYIFKQIFSPHKCLLVKDGMSYKLEDRTFFKDEKELKDFLDYFDIEDDDLEELLTSYETKGRIYYATLFKSGLLNYDEFRSYIFNRYMDRLFENITFKIWKDTVSRINNSMKRRKEIIENNIILIVLSLILIIIPLFDCFLVDVLKVSRSLVENVTDYVYILIFVAAPLLLLFARLRFKSNIKTDLRSYKRWKKKMSSRIMGELH